MSSGFCVRCGATLVNGACPRGHPQRVARTRRQRRRRWPVLLVLLAVGAAAGYLGLVWYPFRAAEALMTPTSSEYATALEAYRAAVGAVPAPGTEPEAVLEAVDPVLAEAEQARDSLADAQLSLEERTGGQVPVVSSRAPLDEALKLRDTMLSFYTSALETVGRLDAVARYLSGLSGSLAQLDDLHEELEGVSPQAAGGAVESALPVADQLATDLEALIPPEELGSVHSTLQAIARRLHEDLRQIADAAEQGGPVVEALLADVEAEVQAFRQAVADAPGQALESGLGAMLKKVERQSGRIREGLAGLRADGMTGITVPPDEPG